MQRHFTHFWTFFFCCCFLGGQLRLLAQVNNDICDEVEFMPDLIANFETCISGSNVGANAELPYLSQGYCNGGTDAPTQAADVWYAFVAVGNRLFINFSSDLDNATLSFYEGDCSALIGRDCVTTDGGNLTYVFEPVDPGSLYFIQVSGGSPSDMSTFEMCVTNEEVFENICINNQTFFIDPLPLQGTFSPGQEVYMCLNVDGYNQNSADWIHGIVPVFGDGWDLSTLSPDPPTPCAPDGVWDWFESVTGNNANGVTAGPGFFYDANSGGGALNGDPGDNYGDPGANNTCPLLFCLTISTVTTPPPGVTALDLSIEWLNFSDAETGSWGSSSPCPLDPNYIFKGVLRFCEPPELTTVSPTCANPNGGSITAIAPEGANPPFEFVWSNGFTETSINNSTISGLSEGFYSVTLTDADDCAQAVSVSLEEISTGLNLNLSVSVGGCSGCEASVQNPVLIDVLDANGAVFASQQLTSCPGILSLCFPSTGSYSLQYGNMAITDAVVNGQVTDDLFTFVTGEPSNPGTMPSEGLVLCDGESSQVSTSGESLQPGHVLIYALHTNSDNSVGNVLATNASGVFSATSGADIQSNQMYYISAVAGPEGSEQGIPDLQNPCLQVAPGTPVVFLTPITTLVDEWCDWQALPNGIFYTNLFLQGGYPAYMSGSLYSVSGDLNVNAPIATGVPNVYEGSQSTQTYTFLIEDEAGCTATASNTFICYKTPIELLSFSGEAADEGNILSWTTASETDNRYFTLERSTNGGLSFEHVAQVAGAGTSSTMRDYKWIDLNAPSGTAYYRLSQTDLNGNTEYQGGIVRIMRNNSSALGFAITQIAPVPVRGETVISFTLPESQNVAFALYNATGQMLETRTLQGISGMNYIHLDMNKYSAGIYLTTLNDGASLLTQKMVRE